MKEHIRKIGGQSMIYGVPEILDSAITVLLIPLYTSYLSKADFGILGLMATVRTALAIFYMLALNSALIKQHFDFETEEERKHYFGSIVTFVIAYNILITVVLTAVGLLFVRLRVSDVPFTPYFITVIWATFFSGLGVIAMIRFRAMDKPLQFSIMAISRFVLSTAITVVLIAKYGLGAMGRLYAVLCTSVGFFAISFYLLRDLNFRPDYRYVRKALKFSLPLFPFFICTWILRSSDNWIIKYYKDLAQVGLYNLGFRVASIMRFVINGIFLAVVQYFYRLAKEEKRDDLGRMATYFAVFMVTVALCVATFGRELIFILAAEPYHPAAAVVPMLTLAFLFRAMFIFPNCAIQFKERTAVMSLVTVAGAVLNLGLNFVLIPRFGMMGAAITTAITLFCMWVTLQFFSQRTYPLKYDYKPIATAALIAGAAYAGQALIPPLPSPLLTRVARLSIVVLGVLVIFFLVLIRYPRKRNVDTHVSDNGESSLKPGSDTER